MADLFPLRFWITWTSFSSAPSCRRLRIRAGPTASTPACLFSGPPSKPTAACGPTLWSSAASTVTPTHKYSFSGFYHQQNARRRPKYFHSESRAPSLPYSGIGANPAILPPRCVQTHFSIFQLRFFRSVVLRQYVLARKRDDKSLFLPLLLIPARQGREASLGYSPSMFALIYFCAADSDGGWLAPALRLPVRRGPGAAEQLLQQLVGGRHHQTPALCLQPEGQLRLQLPACSPTVSAAEAGAPSEGHNIKAQFLLSKPPGKRSGHKFVN